VAKVRRDSDIGMKSETVGYYGSGLRSAPTRKSPGAIYRVRRHAKAIGLLVVFVAALTALSAVALTPSHKLSVGTEGTLPPVASFAVYPNRLTVTVDATLSNDPDGTIDSYAWDFGDGGTGTGVNTTHTYASWGTWWITLTVTDNDLMTGTTSLQVTVSNPTSPPPTPYNVLGYVYQSDGTTPVFNAVVTITDSRTGAVWLTTTDDVYGFFMMDLNTNESGWAMGDTIVIEATDGFFTGSNSGVTGAAGNEAYLYLDLTLTTAIPEFPMVILPVMGMIGIAAVVSLKRRRGEI
jgi:hypothetical protein